MTLANISRDLMQFSAPAPLANLLAGGPMEFYGVSIFRMTGNPFVNRTVVTAMTTSATITSTAIFGRLITGNQGAAGAATYTMPTGTTFGAAWLAALGQVAVAGDSVEFTVCNISTVAAEIVTLAGAAGMTAVGNMTIAANNATTNQSAATFVVVCTATDTFSFYKRA